MSHKLRPISSENLIKFLKRNGFIEKPSSHSHAKLEKTVGERTRNIIVPYSKNDIPKGTLADIYTAAVGFVPELELKNFFLTDFDREYKAEMRRNKVPIESLSNFGLK